MDAMPVNDNAREDSGRQLARVVRIERVGRLWKVPSQTSAADRYLVDIERGTCTCPDYSLCKGTCKHQHAVYFWIAWGRHDATAAEGIVTEPVKKKRKQYPPEEGWSTYRASRRNELPWFEHLLHSFCARIEGPSRNAGPGRNPLPYCDEVFCAVMKMYINKSADLVESALKDHANRGLIRKAPHANSISNFLDDPDTTELLLPLVSQVAAPLSVAEKGQYAIDATGMSTTRHVRWFDFRDGKYHSEHEWIKLHVLVGTKTHAIVAVKVDKSPEGDAKQLEALVLSGLRYHTIEQVSADNAYSKKANFEFLDDMGIQPFIQFQDRNVADPKCESWTRALCEFWFNNANWLPLYHRRSNVESVFSSLKGVLGPSLRSRNPDALVNETLCKCIAHNMRCVIRAIFCAKLDQKLWSDAPKAEEEAA
jgi:transposase